jgi:hypothetical protein
VALAGGTVHLVNVDSQVVAQALTDASGAFALQAPVPGSYFLLARAPGHEASETDLFDVGDAGRRVTFVIGRAPVRLDPVAVDARAETRENRLWYGGFYDRMRQRRDGGRFLSREQIEAARPQHVADLLRRFPSLEVRVGGYGEFVGRRLAVRLRQPLSIRSQCWSVFYLNAQRVEPDAVDTLDPADIEGIEVYANGSVPAQFNAVGSACGVIAIWLRAR